MSIDQAPSSIARQDPPDWSVAQGIVESWDAIAGTNQIRVRGRSFSNLLSAVGSETGLIRAGDNVLVVRLNNTYAVLSRFEPPGVTPRAFGLVSAEVSVLDDPITNGFEARNAPFVDVYIGSSGRCMVTLSMEISISNNVQRLGVFLSGASLIGAMPWRALTVGSVDDLEMQTSRVLMFGPDNGFTLNEGLTRFQVMAQTGNHLANLPLVGEVQITVQPF